MTDQQIAEAVALIQKGMSKEAVDVLEKYLKKHPESIEGWYNLGYAFATLDKPQDALKAYDEALAIDNGIFVIWFNKGTVLYEMADYEKAKECYEEALEIDSEDAEAWNNLGNCHSRLAEGRKAIEAYTRAVALKPDYAEAFYNKANAHFIEGEDEKAIAYAELAEELNPSLVPRVDQWIRVARNRLAAKSDHDEYERRKSSKEED